MVIAYLIVGMISGSLLAVMGLMADSSVWSVFLLYSLGGSLATVGVAGIMCFLTSKSAVPDVKSDQVVPEGSKA